MAAVDSVKQQVAAHWNLRAHFDEDFGNRTEAERLAWRRIFERALRSVGPLDARDCGGGSELSAQAGV
jgi:hypothetical protein